MQSQFKQFWQKIPFCSWSWWQCRFPAVSEPFWNKRLGNFLLHASNLCGTFVPSLVFMSLWIKIWSEVSHWSWLIKLSLEQNCFITPEKRMYRLHSLINKWRNIPGPGGKEQGVTGWRIMNNGSCMCLCQLAADLWEQECFVVYRLQIFSAIKKHLKNKWHISEGLRELKRLFWHKGTQPKENTKICCDRRKTFKIDVFDKLTFWRNKKNFYLNWTHNCRTRATQQGTFSTFEKVS